MGFVRGTYGSTGVPGDTCALLQPYAAGSLIAMKTDLETGFEYRIQLNAKSFGQGQSVRFSFHTAPSSGGAAAGPDVALSSIDTDDPSLPGTEVASAAFTVDAAGTYWAVAQALGDSPSGWARYDNMVLERRPVNGCPSVAGPDVMICRGDTVQIGTGCLPEPHPLDSLEYCYSWIPEAGLDDPESAMPSATPQETTTYRVYVTASDGELVAEDEVTVKVNTVEVKILPEDPSLCYRNIPGARPGKEAPPAENRANGCAQDFIVLSLDGAYTTTEWSTGSAGGSIEVYEPGFYSVSATDANGCTGSAEVEVGMCTAPSLEITSCSLNHLFTTALLLLTLLSAHAAIEVTPLVDCLCESGSSPQQAFNLTAEGTAGPFSFEWHREEGGYSPSTEQNPIDIKLPGNYYVLVTNSFGCTFQYDITIPACPAPSFSGDKTETCPGQATGSITVMAAGGTPPYTYSWSNGADTPDLYDLAEGIYYLTLGDSRGCTKTGFFKVLSSGLGFSVNVAITHPSCAASA
ncbi:MAG: SprB repeat-containing protein [Lewinellaceae bacterium]|nr:SprB repeat-containing protein [Lewinellaceae bacterium]